MSLFQRNRTTESILNHRPNFLSGKPVVSLKCEIRLFNRITILIYLPLILFRFLSYIYILVFAFKADETYSLCKSAPFKLYFMTLEPPRVVLPIFTR